MIGKSYIFHLFLFLLILPDSIYSQDNICLIPQVESMVRKKGTLSIERLESIHFPDEWKNTGNLLVSDLKELANLSVMVNASNPSIHVKKGENAGAGNVHAGNYKAGDHHRSR